MWSHQYPIGGAGATIVTFSRTRPFVTSLVELSASHHSGSSPIFCQTGGPTDADIIAYLYPLAAQVSIAWAAASTRLQALDAKPLALYLGRKQLLVSLRRRL
jgi:hypothetical protein